MSVNTSTNSNSNPARLLPAAAPSLVTPVTGEKLDRDLCIGEDPDTFFPTNGTPVRKPRPSAPCTVRLESLDYAIRADEFVI